MTQDSQDPQRSLSEACTGLGIDDHCIVFSKQDGVFHFNTLLTLVLASPYFSSGQQQERFEVVVMEHKEDGHVR